MPSIDFQLNVHGDVYGKFSPCPLIAGNVLFQSSWCAIRGDRIASTLEISLNASRAYTSVLKCSKRNFQCKIIASLRRPLSKYLEKL